MFLSSVEWELSIAVRVGPLGMEIDDGRQMQRIFAKDTPWEVPWTREVSPAVQKVSSRHPQRAIFTRFVPPARA